MGGSVLYFRGSVWVKLRVILFKVMSYPDFYENDEILKGLIQTVGLPY